MSSDGKKEIAPQDRVKPIKIKETGGRPPLNVTKKQIEYAIHSTQSMRQAADYLKVSYKTFKKYAMIYELWAPLSSNKGIRRHSYTGSFGKHDIGAILSGEHPSPFREENLLRRALQEGYLECKCSNCPADYTNWTHKKPQPLVLDFLDTNPTNTRIENLRILCFNCIYELHNTDKGWYKYRDYPIAQAIREHEPQAILERDTKIPPSPTSSNALTDNMSSEVEELGDYIPFEEFQKTLDN